MYRFRPLRSELWSDVLAIVGIVAGVAVVFVSQVGGASFDHATQTFGTRLVGHSQYQLEARGSAGVSELILYEARRIPGVRRALPVVEEQVNLVAPNGSERTVDLIGIDPRLAQMGTQRLERLTSQESARRETIALPTSVADALGVRVGETVGVGIGSRVVKTRVGALLDERDLGNLAHNPVAVAPIEGAQLITGLETDVSRVFVEAQNGRRSQVLAGLRLLAAREHVNLAPANFDSRLFAVAASPVRAGEAWFATMGTAIGFVLAFAAALTIVPRQRAESADGEREPTRISSHFKPSIAHAFAIGAVSCVFGLLLGDVLSLYVLNLNAGYLSRAFLIDATRVLTWRCVAISVAVGLVATVVGCLRPLRSLLMAADRRNAAPHPRLGLDARLALVAATLVVGVAVFAGMCVQGVQHNLKAGLNAQAGRIGPATDLWVLPRRAFDPLATTSFPYTEREFTELPGVVAVGAYNASFLTWGARRLWVVAPAAMPGSRFFAGEIVGGDPNQVQARLREGGWAVISESIATEHGLHPGETFTLPSPQQRSFRVAGLVAGAIWPAGAIVLNPSDYASAWGSSAYASAVEIQTEPGMSPASIRSEARTTLGPDLEVETGAERARRYAGTGAGLMRPMPTALTLLICCSLAIAALLASLSLRSNSDGLEPPAKRRLLPVGTATLLGVGCSMGAIFGFVGQLLISRALASATGLPVIVGVDLSAFVSAVAITIALCLTFALAIEYLTSIRPRATKPVDRAPLAAN